VVGSPNNSTALPLESTHQKLLFVQSFEYTAKVFPVAFTSNSPSQGDSISGTEKVE
jgi:hypothetical protein